MTPFPKESGIGIPLSSLSLYPPRPVDFIFEGYGASFLVHTLAPQLESRLSGWRGNQRRSPTEQDRNHRYRNSIDQTRSQETPEQYAASEERYIFAGSCAKFQDHPFGIVVDLNWRDVRSASKFGG